MRVILRLVGFIALTFLWVCIFGIWRLFFRDKLAIGIIWRLKWLKIALPMLGVRVNASGLEHLTSAPALYVANHRSYIDPVVALRYAQTVIVAKAELSSWPLLGTATSMGAVLFVKRGDRDSRSGILNVMEMLVKKGFSLCVFPEGTTSRYPELLEFRPGAFHLASKQKIPVIPMAMEFEDPDDAWVGTDTFLRHFFQTFRKKTVVIHMRIGPPLRHDDGVILKDLCHKWIEETLTSLAKWVQKK